MSFLKTKIDAKIFSGDEQKNRAKTEGREVAAVAEKLKS